MGERTRQQPRSLVRRRRGLWAGGTALAGAVLLLCYLRVAGTTEVNSDGAGLVLQASDMLHGNLLLHGWWNTDVSFLTTELPEYAAVTGLAGISPAVVHISAALTYTLLVLLAAFVARGRARGAEGVVRALLAAGVMLAPQPTGPTPVLLSSPDHVGTAAPLLALLLLLDRVQDRMGIVRWCMPGIVAVLLAWSIVGDPLLLVVGVLPLALACLLRAGRTVAVEIAAARIMGTRLAVTRTEGRRALLAACRAAGYEAALAVAALVAVPLAAAANALIRSHGGYHLGPALYHLMRWPAIVADAPMAWRSFLALFGADYSGVTGAGNVAFAVVHLAGVAVVLAGVVLAAWRLISPARTAPFGDLVADVLVLAVLLNIAAYLTFVHILSIWTAHEIGPVLGLGAALAGRMLGGPLLRLRLPARPGAAVGLPLLAAGLACYVALLGVAAAYPQAPAVNANLAAWLRQHHLHSGLGPYWQASSVTVDSGGSVTLLAIGVHGRNHNRLALDYWESDLALADPARHSANFVVVTPNQLVPAGLAIRQFGQPARIYRYAGDVILVWHKNLLTKIWNVQVAHYLTS